MLPKITTRSLSLITTASFSSLWRFTDLTPTSLAWISLCALISLLVASAMGLFGGNKMPVEGKVRRPRRRVGNLAWRASLTKIL